MDENAKLLDMFSPHTYEEWRQAVDKALKGTPFEKVLVKNTYEDIDIQPIYSQRDVENLPHMGAVPGFAPFVRGANALGHVVNPWLISQEICHGDPVEFNRVARAELERGQNALNIPLDKATLSGLNPDSAKPGDVGRGGLSLATVDDAAKAFDGIDLEQIPILLQAGASGLAVVALIASFMRKQGKSTEKLRGWVAVDPLGTLSLNGTLPLTTENAYQEMAQLTVWAKDNAPRLRTIAIHGHPYHNGGGSAVQELAFTVATGVEYVREMLSRGLSIDDIAQQIGFSLSIGSDFFMEIAKLRAVRLVWEKVVDTFGGNDDSKRTYIHARTSSWNKTVTAPYVNMLRVTTEAFAAICGGCDSMHVAPFDEAIGLPDDFSRRIARNVQILLRDECHFNQVVDPAGGSWYVEAITDAVARKTWQLFQEVEKKGGMFKALQEGFPQEHLTEKAAKRAKGIDTRNDVFIGTNKYPELLEKPPKTVQLDDDALYKDRCSQMAQYKSTIDSDKNPPIPPLPKGGKGFLYKLFQDAGDVTGSVVEEAIGAAMAGMTLGEITKSLRSEDGAKVAVDPVRIYRGAEPFESLRKAADDYVKKTGSRRKIFLANMGPIPQHKARADFSIDFFSVGGFEVINNKGFPDVDEAVDAAIGSGAKVVVICSTDKTYPELVPPLTRKIKEADPDITVILAGYPKEHVETFKEAGVDDFIHIRANVFELLKRLQN